MTVSATVAAETASAAPPPPPKPDSTPLHDDGAAAPTTAPLWVKLQNWSHSAGTVAAALVMYQAFIIGGVAGVLATFGVDDPARLARVGIIEGGAFTVAGTIVKVSKWIDSHHDLGVVATTIAASAAPITAGGS